MENYRPLPDNVSIKSSGIDGLGLFATADIVGGETLGITHVSDDRFPDGYIRTPLGGFYNYEVDSNCENIEKGDFLLLRTKRYIQKGEELTATYKLYDPR
jgi:hypothetical protein